MSNYGSTGDNLLAGRPPEEKKRDYWRQYMSGGGSETAGKDTRHMDQVDRVHKQQLAAAEAYYQGATAPSNLYAAQQRGQALRQSLGGLGEGGLAARQAIMGSAAGSYGAGLAGTQQGSEARLSAADAYMGAQSDRARYDMAIARAWQQRDAAAEARDRQIEQAIEARKRGEYAAALQAFGAAAGASGSAMAAMDNSGGGNAGGGGGGYSATHPNDESGAGYGAAKYA